MHSIRAESMGKEHERTLIAKIGTLPTPPSDIACAAPAYMYNDSSGGKPGASSSSNNNNNEDTQRSHQHMK